MVRSGGEGGDDARARRAPRRRHPALPAAGGVVRAALAAALRVRVLSFVTWASFVGVVGPLGIAHATPAAEGDRAAAAPVAAASPRPTVVRFLNRGPGVTLRVDGGAWLPLMRGEHRDVEAGGEALRYVVARGSEWQYGGELALTATSARLVVIEPPQGHVEVTNRSGEACDFRWGDRYVAAIAPDATRVLGPLALGEVVWRCEGQRSRSSTAGRLRLDAGGRAALLIPPPAHALRVANPADEPVRLLVDERDHGRLEPGAEVAVVGLALGIHQVTLRGLRTGREIGGEQTVAALADGDRGAATITVVIANETGEALVLPPALSGLHEGPIAAGAEVRLLLPGVATRLRLRGDASQLDYERDVQTAAGATQRWRIVRPQGRLLLRNATGADAELQIDERPALRLKRGAALRVRGVPAGRLTLRVHVPASDARFERVVQLEAARELAWVVRAGRSELVVDNGHAEPVELAIDGVPRGQIAAGGSFRALDIAPGPHAVHALTLYSRRREAARVEVADGARATLALEPPGGSVKVRNDGAEPLTVLLAGAPIGAVQPGRERALPVPAGRIIVDIRDATGRVASWAGRLAPGQSLPLPAPRAVGAGVVIDNPGPSVLFARVDERGDWRAIGAGASWRPDVAPGEHLIELRFAEGAAAAERPSSGAEAASAPSGGTGAIEERRRVVIAADGPDYRLAPILSR